MFRINELCSSCTTVVGRQKVFPYERVDIASPIIDMGARRVRVESLTLCPLYPQEREPVFI
jgi:hypothetical protein